MKRWPTLMGALVLMTHMAASVAVDPPKPKSVRPLPPLPVKAPKSTAVSEGQSGSTGASQYGSVPGKVSAPQGYGSVPGAKNQGMDQTESQAGGSGSQYDATDSPFSMLPGSSGQIPGQQSHPGTMPSSGMKKANSGNDYGKLPNNNNSDADSPTSQPASEGEYGKLKVKRPELTKTKASKTLPVKKSGDYFDIPPEPVYGKVQLKPDPNPKTINRSDATRKLPVKE